MYKMITTGLLCVAAVALKAQDAPVDSVAHTKSNTLGASSTVYTNDLVKYQSATILTGLQGRLKGLNVSPFRGMQLLRTDANTKSDIVGAIPNVGGGIYGDNSEFLISARGQSPVAIVDGVERDLYSIDPEAIESVTIQKDALSNMFLGMRSSRGALIITTKNPDAKGGFHLSLTGKFGISSALKSGPNPLSAYQYAYLLNEALLNDGKSPLYTYDDFEAYRNGTSPYLHPDVNWKDAIMNNSTTSQAYNLNVTGGGRVAQYFVSLGYYSENGLFKTSDANSYNTNFKYNRYLITSKVNINVTDEFKVSMSLMGRIEEGNQPGGISGTGYSDLLSNVWQTPNNAYPVLNPNGTYGGNASYTQNLYAQTTGSGYISSNTRDVVGTINLKYDFDKLVKGLSVGATGNISSQVRNAIVRTKQAQVFQYSITQQGNEAYDKYGDVSSQTNSYRSVSTYQYMYGKMYVDWERQFGMHGVKASLWGDTRTILNNYDLPMIPSNIGQKVEYNYDNKYFAQAAVTESYYNRYDNGRRWGTFWAVGLGWDISKEKFMENVKFIDDLKITASYANLHQDLDITDYYLYKGTFSKRTNEGFYVQWHDGTAGGWTPASKRGDNPNLGFITREEFRAGIDATLFNRLLKINANYFRQDTKGLLTQGSSSIYPSYFALSSNSTFMPWINYNEDRRSGFDFALSTNKKFGDFDVTLGFNGMVYSSEALKRDELYDEDYQYRKGRALDASYGYVCEGFFQDQTDIDNHARQTFGTVKPGDLKYKDINEDGVIDSKDQIELGKNGWSAPPFSFGLNLTVKWKNFSLFAMGSGQTGSVDFKSSSYYWNRGTSKFSEVVWGRWTEDTKDVATYPRLTTTNGDNNYRNSTFWMYKRNYFRLNQVQLTYDFPENTFKGTFVRGLSVYCGGSNLLTISKERKHMELSTGSPQCRNFYAGFKAAF